MTDPVLYRKYRPQKFSEVLGQEHIVSALVAAVETKAPAHAYLFAGSRGTGKTSVARIFAREIGCAPEDLYEMDGASNRNIDDVRELREAVKTLPFNSPYKVYIIDEVHMFTKESANALLKTLEEPPKHVVFILATTDPDKLPDTIISRCQVFKFKKPAHAVLGKMVLAVAKKEGVALAPAAAELVALLGDGSFRDAIGLLQQVMGATADKKIKAGEVEAITGAPRRRLVEEFLTAAAGGDLEKSLTVVHQAALANYDFKVLVKLILRQLRLALLLKFAPSLGRELTADLPPAETKFLTGLTAAPAAAGLVPLLRELLAVYDEFTRAGLPELPLELALIKLFSQTKS